MDIVNLELHLLISRNKKMVNENEYIFYKTLNKKHFTISQKCKLGLIIKVVHTINSPLDSRIKIHRF